MKKIVEYSYCNTNTVVVGQRAEVVPVNHPDTFNVTNGYGALTSRVVSIGAEGQFETLNSIYVKAKEVS